MIVETDQALDWIHRWFQGASKTENADASFQKSRPVLSEMDASPLMLMTQWAVLHSKLKLNKRLNINVGPCSLTSSEGLLLTHETLETPSNT
jgi:hypothetical protein